MLEFERTGEGPSLVLVHGITESHHTWDPLISGLSENFDVVALDLRGHGASVMQPPYDLLTMTGDVHELVEFLDLQSPLMVGHSLGGTVVSAYGATYPCRGVINVDQSLQLSGFVEVLTPLKALLKGTTEEFESAMSVILDVLRGRLNDDEWRRIGCFRRLDQDVVLGIWSVVFETPPDELDALGASVARAVTVPYLSLHGSGPGDHYAAWLTGLIPTCSVKVWEGDGHYPHLVEPDRFISRVVDFHRAS